MFSQLTEGHCGRPLLIEGQLQMTTSILSKKETNSGQFTLVTSLHHQESINVVYFQTNR